MISTSSSHARSRSQSQGNHLAARSLAYRVLQEIDQQQAYANIALDRALQRTSLPPQDRHLVTELVYGITRRCRTLDALISHYCPKPATEQPPALRRILWLGFYQLCFLPQIPVSAAINTSVELARSVGLGRLTQVVNGVLRTFLRQCPDPQALDQLPIHTQDPIQALAVRESFPDWLVQMWWDQLGPEQTEQLCRWFNRRPTLDLRVNRHRISVEEVVSALEQAGIAVQVQGNVPGALRLLRSVGDLTQLPGFAEGWWSVQDAGAQQVVQLLDPQPGELIVDCCAAPGGKTTQIAEQMGDQGTVWALDRHRGRLQRVLANAQRLQLNSIRIQTLDLVDPKQRQALDLPATGTVDRLLLDVPCSGLGTLHRHGDARWKQRPESIVDLIKIQSQLLDHCAPWVRSGGVMVYSSCTLHPEENHRQIDRFLQRTSDWSLDQLPHQIWPHQQDRDGFFMAKLIRQG